MSTNPIPGQSKDQLLDEMLCLAKESNFYQTLEQTLKQILQCKTLTPYLYLHKKISLKSKFDNSKSAQYFTELTVYLSSVSPLILSKQTITNKLMSLCIDKFNHLKIKKFETNQFINFLLIDLGEKEKSGFIKEMNEEKMENDNLTVIVFANIMYWTIVYLWAVREIAQLASKLKNSGILSGNSNSTENLITSDIMNEYLNSVDPQDSILKLIDVGQISEGQNILDKVVEKIFQLFDGNNIKDNKKY